MVGRTRKARKKSKTPKKQRASSGFTVEEVIRRLLPKGSIPGADGSFDECPIWPPDLFAVAATLLERSSVYVNPAFTTGWNAGSYIFDDNYVNDIESIGDEWAKTTLPPVRLKQLWKALLAESHADTYRSGAWQLIAMRLMGISDHAAAGFGFAPEKHLKRADAEFMAAVINAYRDLLAGTKKVPLPYIPSSLCVCVPKHVVCVQPKTMVPTVGCTLRSLSHNLCLLPPSGVVEASWLWMTPFEMERKPLNLVLIPYPFVLSASDFSATAAAHDDKSGYFSYKAGWRNAQGRLQKPRDIADAICELIRAAKRETNEVHGVVLPEMALTETQAIGVARQLARRVPSLELFISGISNGENTGGNAIRNSAYTARLYKGAVLNSWRQSKHHRWGLDKNQIVRYHLGAVLDPSKSWWEKINVSNRTCTFSVIRPGASLAVLVCEDLARFDPVMPIVHAVGPNLVIALLMDGPQTDWRWPARYATVLADDPGSSVLTLTSLGMVRRSIMPGESECREIALWKEQGGEAKALKLSPGDHALVVALTMEREQQETMDRRKDNWCTEHISLSAVRGIRFSSKRASKWLQLD